MSYIGVQPTPVPLQSSQLAENLIVPNLTVAGGATVGGALAANSAAISGGATVGGFLTVTGAASVGGAATLSGNVSVGGTLAVTGRATFPGQIGTNGTTTEVLGQLKAPLFQTLNGTVSVPNNVDTLLATVAGQTSTYLVTAAVELAGGGTGLAPSATETVLVNIVRWSAIGSSLSARVAALGDGTSIITSATLVGSDFNISVTQTTGSTRNVPYSIMRIA